MAFNVRKKKSPLRSTRLAERKRRILIIKTSLISFLVLLIVSSLLWLVHVQALNINTVAVSGNSAVDTSDVQTIVSRDISGSYLFIIPRTNRFFYPKSKIKVDVLTAFPRFQNVVVKSSGSTLTIEVVERQPSYVWCEGTPQTSTESGCYSIDNQGYIFGTAPTISGNVFFHFYGLAGTTSPINTHYMSEASFMAVDKFITSLNTLGIQSYALNADQGGMNTLYLSSGGKLIFQSADTYSDVLSNVATVIKQTEIFKHGQNLDYVDFRFGNKVYYKLIGDNSPTESEQ